MNGFQQAFEQLLQRAPGPVFPRARQLYLRKYALEAHQAPSAGDGGPPFRTFLWQETIEESTLGAVSVLRIRAVTFALVHWQAPQTSSERYRHYLQQQWQLTPQSLELQTEAWFREGGAWARFTTTDVLERQVHLPLMPSPTDQPETQSLIP